MASFLVATPESGLLSVVIADDSVRFDRDVRGILSDKCFACHGPDAAHRQADLRLDQRTVAVQPLPSGATAIVPGQAETSELMARITSSDPDLVMPPPSAKLGSLTANEIRILREWINSGAEYQAHWAFLPVEPVAEPGGIDAFVEAGLKKQGRSWQPEADRSTLIRRVSFDLTGLPPTTAEVQAFVSDSSEQAYERLVDRLLQSPRYGERMAADWLDVARYADSYGFQVDREREMWPWRDWVINAFNRNLPWDQFVTWQLAGDLLPEPTDEQILATAFNRLNQQEAEGGSVEEEYRVNSVNDRVVTFGTAFLGLTLECCRCHDHKFDPLTQKEFYQLFAFFDDIDEAGLYSYFTNSAPPPAMWLMNDDMKQSQRVALEELRRAEEACQQQRDSVSMRLPIWLEQRPAVDPILVDEMARFSFDERDSEGKFVSNVGENVSATSDFKNEAVPGVSGKALRLTGDLPVTTTVGNFHRYEPFTVSLWLQTPDVKERAVVFHRSRAWTDAASRGYELLIEEGRLKLSLIHFWPGDAISIRCREALPLGTWQQVTVTYDGSSRADGLQIFVNGVPAAVEVIRDHLTREITGGGGDTIALGERFRDRGFTQGLIDELRVFRRALSRLEIAELHQAGAIDTLLKADLQTWTDQQRALVTEFYLSRYDESLPELMAQRQAARKKVAELAEQPMEMMVMRDMPTPKTAYLLKRGEYAARGEAVEPGTPASLLEFPADQPRNRLGLARWLTHPRHPLLARVTVNRFWQSLWGRGLVKTPDDFGSQSIRPVYPDVLDWLAGEFIRSGWDTKHLLKTIVMSRTYRQRSFSDAAQMAEDPENQWLARGPRFRLPAEMIRDNVLLASGLLVEKTGGAPVRTYDLPESFKPSAAGTGEQLYRRSIYTFWKRTGPAPVLEAFDVPKRQICIARRDSTNTALHAMILLNGPQFVEAARVLAEDVWKETEGEVAAALSLAFVRLTSREPDMQEQQILRQMFEQQRDWYRQHSEEAAAYLKIGEHAPDAALPVADVAATASVINALMNYDGCMVKR